LGGGAYSRPTMHRRQFLRGTLGAALVAPLLGDAAAAQRGQPAAPPPRPSPATPRRLILDAHSRNLHWLRSPDEVAQAAIEMVCGGVCVTVQPRPGHVDPARVGEELPAFVKQIRSHGLRVTQIAGPATIDPADPLVERVVATAAQNGI